MEIRSVLPVLHDLKGNYKSDEYTFQTFMEVDKKFREEHADDYIGSKIIYGPIKMLSNEELKETVLTSIKFYENHKEYFCGYDLVGQEDISKPLKEYLDILLLPQKLGKNLPYIFHAGIVCLFCCLKQIEIFTSVSCSFYYLKI